MRVILWTIAAIVSSIANGKFLLWQNDLHFAYRIQFLKVLVDIMPAKMINLK